MTNERNLPDLPGQPDLNSETASSARPGPAGSVPLHRRLRWIGLSVLSAGWLVALLIYVWPTQPGTALPDFSADRRFNFELERIGGKQAVLLASFSRWMDSLWHGTALAWTVASLSLLVALFCFWLSGLMAYPELPGHAAAATPSDQA